MVEIQRREIGGKTIAIFDEAFDEDRAFALEQQLRAAYYSLYSSSSVDTSDFKEAMCEFDKEDFEKHFLYGIFLSCLEHIGFKKTGISCHEILAKLYKVRGILVFA